MSDLNLFRAFLTLFETRNVSEAALQMDLSQPGMSAILRRLREQFGDELFIRTKTGMIPTHRARQIELPIRRIMDIMAQDVMAAMPFDPATTTRSFVIGTSDMSEYIFLPKLMSEFARLAPAATLAGRLLQWSGCERELEKGELDLLLGLAPDMMSGNIFETSVSNFTFGCFVGRHHPMAGQTISLDDLAASPHVICDNEERWSTIIDRHLATHGLRRKIVLTTARMLSVPEVLSKSDLMGLLPLKPGLPSPYTNIAQVFVPCEFPVLDIKLYWHRVVHEDPAHAWFRSLVARVTRTVGATVHGGNEEATDTQAMKAGITWPPMDTTYA